MSSPSFVPTLDPSPESVLVVRALISERLAEGAKKASLAREAGLEPRTFSAFVDNPNRIPSDDTWRQLREWYYSSLKSPRYVRESLMDLVSRVTPDEFRVVEKPVDARARRESLQETLRLQRQVLQTMRTSLEMQERIVDRLESALIDAVADEVGITPAVADPMDAVTAAAVAASDPTRTAAAADASPEKRKRGSAGG